MAKKLIEMGYSISATFGTASFFEQQSVPCLGLKKVHQGRPNCVDRIRSGDVAFVVNTASGRQSIQASFSIRRSCIDYFIPCLTESDAALAFLVALEKQRSGQFEVRPLPKI
jgi:carbamoyl-phosphate synthase large subunit